MGLIEGSAAEAGLDPARLDQIRERGQRWVTDREKHRTVVLLAARNGVIALHEAFGVDGPEPDAKPLERDAVFHLASQTKSYTAALVMQLVEDGLIGLTRPVQEYLPEFVGERKEQVLVHHLLTHTAGIDDADAPAVLGRLAPQLAAEAANATPGQQPLEHVFLEVAYTWPVAHPVGSEMRYSPLVGYLLLGEIVRRVTGRSLDEQAQQRLFGPLGMIDSSFGVPDERVSRIPGRSFEFDPGSKALHRDIGRGATGGAGGAYGTALDLARFLQLFLDDGRAPDGARVLHPTTVARMTTNQLPGLPAQTLYMTLREASYGIGWIVQQAEPSMTYAHPPNGSIKHAGAGFHCPWADPRTGVVGVFCSVADQPRTDEFADFWDTSDEFADLVSAAVTDR